MRPILLISIALAAAVPVAAQPAPDPAFTGHYYLSGVMETGSELLLRPDGRFDWFLAYGALDQVAKGKWERRGQTVVLIADAGDKTRPLFTLAPQQPWSAKAEAALREAEEDERRRAIDAKCPFLYGAITAPMVVASDLEDDPPPASKADAEAALALAIARRGEAELAMAAVIAEPSEAANVKAAEAMAAWFDARSTAFGSYYQAGLEPAQLDDPKPPPACTIPPYEPRVVSSPSVWKRGRAILVGDRQGARGFGSVEVTFHLGDGSEARGVTDPDGWAIVAKSATPIVAVTLAIPEADPPLASGRLAMTPLTEGVQPVRIDIEQLMRSPFTELVLKIEGRDLLPERGRYSRD